MSEGVGKVPILAIKIVTGLSFGTAITFAVGRIVIRLNINKRLSLDDWLLVLACVTLTAGTGLLLYSIPTVYLIEATSLDPLGLFGDGGAGIDDLDTLLIKINFFARFNWAYLILSWTTIFAVKFGFLSFFGHLVRGLPDIYRYWRGVVAVCAVVYAFSLVDGVIACPHDGLTALSCSVGYARAIGAVAIGLDILTDLLILAIPIHLLWKVQIKLRQKLGLAAFLCLSVFMIIIAVIRISGFIYRHAFDEGWVYLWQQIEACVSVSTISLTAFRSMFVAGASRREISPWQKSPGSVSWRRRYKKSATSSRARELDDLSIPGGTLTGVRTAIGGPRTQHDTLLSKPGEEDWPLRPPAAARTSLGRLKDWGHDERGSSSLGRPSYQNLDERGASSLGRPSYQNLEERGASSQGRPSYQNLDIGRAERWRWKFDNRI